MGIQNQFLFQNVIRETKVYSADEANFEEIILENYEFKTRWPLETNFDYKQPLPYGVIMNNENKIFVYQRWWSKSAAAESRLHNKVSIGVGWHIEEEDIKENNLLRDSLIREVEEEIWVKESDIKKITLIGYINYEENEVSRVHLGIWYVIQISESEIIMDDGELADGEFKTLEEYKEMIASGKYDIEPWSLMLVPFIDTYINNF